MDPLELDSASVGDRIREHRAAKGVSVRELARRIGVSASLVSQIERGRVSPSVSTLYAMVQELDMSLDELFDRAEGALGRGTQPDQPGEQRPAAQGGPNVVRAGEGKTIHLGAGVEWELLTPDTDPAIDFLHATYDVGATSSSNRVAMRHPGYEYGRVIQGLLRVTVGFDGYDLGPGDSISFDSMMPHLLENIGEEPVHVVWFVLGRHGVGHSEE
jgi:transcriptional regulator with XRE-family HTH domain